VTVKSFCLGIGSVVLVWVVMRIVIFLTAIIMAITIRRPPGLVGVAGGFPLLTAWWFWLVAVLVFVSVSLRTIHPDPKA
jgi:hypothetical protein